jgi:replicative DNA helicase
MMEVEKLCKTAIEESVLSSILYDNQVFFSCETERELFTGTRIHIYNSIKKILDSGGDANIVTVSTDLKGVLPASAVAQISDAAVSGNLEYSIEILKEAERSRKLYRVLSGALNMCVSGEETSTIMAQTKDVFWKAEKTMSKGIYEILPDVLKKIEDISTGLKEPGMRTGINAIDRATGGLSSGLIIIAGRPGTGKTSLAMNIARNFASRNSPGLVFSLEMSQDDLLMRMICDVGLLDSNLFFRGEIKFKPDHEKQKIFGKVDQISGTIADYPIKIDQTSSLTVDQIYARAKKAKVVDRIEWVIVDYLGLINGWNQEGQGPKSEITRKLKTMSGELELPVIVLSQMNRGIEHRGEKTPILADLRDAGSIEQDADLVLFPIPDTEVEGMDDQGATLFIAKNRKGPTCKATDLAWIGKFFRYENRGRNIIN